LAQIRLNMPTSISRSCECRLSALTSSNTRRSCANCFFDSFDFIDTSSGVAVVDVVVVVVVVVALFDALLDANRRDKRKSDIIVEILTMVLSDCVFAVSAKAFVSNAACGDQGQNAVGQLAAHLRSHDALASRDRWIAPPPSSSSSSSSSAMQQLHAHAHAQRLVDEFQRERAAPAPTTTPWADEFVRHAAVVHAVPWANEFHAAYAVQPAAPPPERFDDFEQFEAWARLQQTPLHESVRAVASEQDQVRDDLRRLARRYREPTAAAWAAEYARDLTPAKDAWAAEFAASASAAPPAWIEEFRRTESQPTAEAWASEFARERTAAAAVATTTTMTTTQRELLDEFLGEAAAASTADENFAQSAAAASSLERFAEYVFASPNPFLDAADPFGDGQRLFRSGSLADAVLALEAAVQRAPGGVASASAAPAWALLGQAHAENDHDGRAISCLMRAVDADNSDLNALIALGVSCANDYYRDEALNLLETWLDQHPDYRHVAAEMPAAPPFRTIGGGGADVWVQSFERHARVTAMFLRAANLKAGAAPDANVQTALGLLYNLSYEYDRAADCFRAALSVQPDNYSLWNKLGATLANGNDSRAALAAYHRALALKPQYVRARANLGIAHLALGEFNDAAHHLSLALKRHGAADDEHLWNNLELVCRLMENDTAAQRARARDVALLNQFS
jgi:tetratricopeptide (TPR) repeat protein